MWKLIACGLWVAFAALLTAAPAAAEEGRDKFLQQRCNLCHGIATDGVEKLGSSPAVADDPFGEEDASNGPPDLSLVGDRHQSEWIVAFLRKEVDLDGRKHPMGFTGTEAELDSIVAYLSELGKTPDESSPGSD